MDGVICEADEIQVGDTVRSYDFPDDDREDAKGCYAEGVVEKIDHFAFDGRECLRYQIAVQRRFWQGKPDTSAGRATIYPPVNGSKSWLGKVYNGVVKVSENTPT